MGILDIAAYIAAAIALVGGLAATLSLLTGNAGSAAFLAGVALLFGMLPVGVLFNSRADHLRCRSDAITERQRAETLAIENEEAVKRWQLLESELSRLVDDERGRIYGEVDRDRRKAEKMVTFAEEREKTIDRLGKRFLSDTVKVVSGKLTGQNFTTQRDRLMKAIQFCRKHEYDVTSETEQELLDDLREEYEAVLRKEHQKAEQARIKARIREEQKAEREIERERKRIKTEQKAIQQALDVALKQAEGEHSAEVEALKEKLAEAEAKSQRALSMAQQTKAGHIYVISNIGSFGEGIYKVGMTRRLEPMDRVKELGDASVPFPFDVHMMISCDDAPTLENTLHKALHGQRVNKVNLRKEYFRASIDEIRDLVIANHGEVDYVANPEAFEYRETMSMSDEDYVMVGEAQENAGFDEEDEWE